MISTTIHNEIRTELSISIDEYLVAAAIDFFAYSPYNREPWAYKKGRDVADLFGFSERTVTRALSVLGSAGLIEKSGKHKVRTTVLWRDIHSAKNIANGARPVRQDEERSHDDQNSSKNDDIEAKWESFWAAYRPINSKDKANSKKSFLKVAAFYDAIMSAIPKYKDELSRESWKHPKMASAWLNARRWDDYDQHESDPKNIANGAPEVFDPFAALVGRLYSIAKGLFDNGGIDGVASADMSAYAFDDQETIFIESAGGFLEVLRNVLDGDFQDRYRSVWEGVA